MNEERILALEERVEMLEFKVQLLSEDSNVHRLLLECNITRNQYVELMNLMDEFRDTIERAGEVSSPSFEQEVYRITGKNGDYHFCESLAKSFMEDDRWEEVFPALYGGLEKYRYYMERRMRDQ